MTVGRLVAFVLDCPDPPALAEFYAAVTGEKIRASSPDWVQLGESTGSILAFQLVEDYQPPDWPSVERSQQGHLDFHVSDLDSAETAIIALGASKPTFQPHPDEHRVYLDPVGHPFCLVLDTPPLSP